MARILGASRFLTLLGVILCLALAILLFVAALAVAWVVVIATLTHLGDAQATHALVFESIELVDICLIATALYLVGVGLYELFIGKLPLPGWLIVTSLDDLKAKLISVVVVVLAVTFLGQVADWDGKTNLLPYGVAIGAVILALTAYSLVHRSGGEGHGAAPLASPESVQRDSQNPDAVNGPLRQRIPSSRAH